MTYLDIKTGYSYLKGYGSPAQIFERAKVIGETSIGIADRWSTWGHIPFWKAGKKAGIKVCLGVQIPVVNELDKDPRHDLVTLIAKDQAGLQSQYEALTLATSQFYFRPRLTWRQVEDLPGNFKIVNLCSPESRLPEDVYIGAAPRFGYMHSLALSGNYNVVASVSPQYPAPEYLEAWQLVNAIGTASKTADIDPVDAWMFHRTELVSLFLDKGVAISDVERWISEAQLIAAQCNAEPPQAVNVRPKADMTIEEWCRRGAVERNIDIASEPYKSRLEYELKLIHQKGFVDYFLLIADLIGWAKSRMFVGPARGSSAGSLVCYLMGIVEIDPIVHGLMFERFIDVTRTDLPDVDIDFPDERRDEVFEYVSSKYGAHRVARLGTVSVFKAKSAIGDVAKCYNIPKWEVDQLSEVLIERSGGDARANMTVMDTINQFEKARALVEKYPDLRMAERLEGHPRHTGKHAAGIVIADDQISRYCAIDHYKDGISEITKYDAEAIGLMKIDALGLKTLSVIQDCCDQVGMDPRELYRLPYDRTEAFEIFQKDKVAGVFQFEGYAVRSLMRQMGVTEFNDIVALTALARPGPLHCGGANEFIVRRTGSKDWDYPHPRLADHTRHTYGTIVYQEQVMSITRDLGGMDWQDVNTLRRAMSKSYGEEFFNQFRDKFLNGTRERGIPDKVALEIWAEMCTFGSWAFNLSHAVSYAVISYWCAYLKARHPVEFAVANLRRAASDDHVFRLLRELAKEGYEIIPFDIEYSDINWSTRGGKIYGGFTSVRGVGEISAAKFKAAREADPDGWIGKLTLAQRSRLLAPNNTPWHQLNRLHAQFAGLYDGSSATIHGGLVNIEDIKETGGAEYTFVATLKVRNLRDLNETQSLAKRGGKVIEHNNLFLNLQFEDDTGSILCTIDRFKYPAMGKPLMEEESDGKDFLIRGSIREEGRRKIHIKRLGKIEEDKIVLLGEDKFIKLKGANDAASVQDAN